jgi:hypothetical protein
MKSSIQKQYAEAKQEDKRRSYEGHIWTLHTLWFISCLIKTETNSRIVLKIINDYVSNLKKGLVEPSNKCLHEMFNYATLHNHTNILRILKIHIPEQVFCNDILGIIYENLCELSPGFVNLMLVNKTSKKICEDYLAKTGFNGPSLLFNMSLRIWVSRCEICDCPGLLVKGDDGNRTCVNKCKYYCENRACTYFGELFDGTNYLKYTKNFRDCRWCRYESIVFKKDENHRRCRRNGTFAPEHAKCMKSIKPYTIGCRTITIDIKENACSRCYNYWKESGWFPY